MFLNTETKASGVAEVPAQQLVFLDLQSTLQKLHCLIAADSHVAGNLLVTPDPEGPHSVPSCTESQLPNKYTNK